MACVIPLSITAIGCFVLFFISGPLVSMVGITD
jgi:hypothetical protein